MLSLCYLRCLLFNPIVENWLAMSLSMMQMSIKTLELQKSALDALRPQPADPHSPSTKK